MERIRELRDELRSRLRAGLGERAPSITMKLTLCIHDPVQRGESYGANAGGQGARVL
jgi:hypothetical protein